MSALKLARVQGVPCRAIRPRLAMHAADCGLVESMCRPLSSAFNSVDRHNSHLTGVKLVRHLHPV